jgi:peptide chain release factor 1
VSDAFAAALPLLAEHAEIETQLSDPSVHADAGRARTLGRRYAELGRVAAAYKAWEAASDDAQAAAELAEDPSFAAELPHLQAAADEAAAKLRNVLIPRDPDDARDVILEVKAGEGGEESALFAADLLRMYTRYAEKMGWATQLLEATESDMGGYKDAQLAVKSRGAPAPEDGVWAHLKYEGGVHRVQRVPVTESQGRIHTSAAGVLVFPEADDEGEVEIDPNDLRIDVYRSSGPGGQSVNTTDSAVRITHLPTGVVVSVQNERSQTQNKARAMQILAARLAERTRQERQQELDALSGEKRDVAFGSQIRTYTLQPYQLVKDERTRHESGNVQAVLDGEIDEFIESYLQWRRGQSEPAG